MKNEGKKTIIRESFALNEWIISQMINCYGMKNAKVKDEDIEW